MYTENIYPVLYYFVVQRQITPAQYQVVEFDNSDDELSLTEAREEVNQSFESIRFEGNGCWKVLCSASSVDDAYDVINRAIDIDAMLICNLN